METLIQPKITGYRQLSEVEAQQMNRCKALADAVGDLCEELAAKAKADPTAVDARWIAIGKTDLQKGFMALVRSIAKPTSF